MWKTYFLALLLFVICASTALGCPVGKEKLAIEKSIISELGVKQDAKSTLDYVLFLAHPKNPNACFVFASISEDGDCHACHPTISIYELMKNEKGWRRTFEQRAALNTDTIGAWGKAPAPELIELNGPAFRFDDVGMMTMGDVSNSITLVAKVAGQFREVLSLQTHEDNSGAPEEDPYKWDADVEFVKKANGYPDIKAKYSGTEKNGKKIQQINKPELYTFDGEQYQLMKP
jgi:hypothetical protein